MKTFTAKIVTGLCLPLLAGTGLVCTPAEGDSAEAGAYATDRAARTARPEAEATAPRHKQPTRSGKSRASRRSGLDQKVVAHSDSANVRDLIKFLAPQGWRVRFDVAAARVDRALVFHAETTRRRALDQLCSSLGLKGIFYPRKRLVLIVEGRPS